MANKIKSTGKANPLNTRQPRHQSTLAKARKGNHSGMTILQPADLVELRTRQSTLLACLDQAIADKDIETVYWIQVEILSICHIFGIPSPLGSTIGVEVLRGSREMKNLAIPEVATAETYKSIIASALSEASAVREIIDIKEEADG